MSGQPCICILDLHVHICIRIYIYAYICIYVHTYVYISLYIYIPCVCLCAHTYCILYICRYRWRERERIPWVPIRMPSPKLKALTSQPNSPKSWIPTPSKSFVCDASSQAGRWPRPFAWPRKGSWAVSYRQLQDRGLLRVRGQRLVVDSGFWIRSLEA